MNTRSLFAAFFVCLSPVLRAADMSQMAPSCHAEPATFSDKGVASTPPSTLAVPPKETWPPQIDVPSQMQTSSLGNGLERTTVLFKGIPITKVYPSMHGPWTRRYVKLFPDRPDPYLWVTRYRAEVLDGETGEASQEFMCHTNMDVVGAPGTPHAFERLQSQLSISQGQKEVEFPKGFALKMSHLPDVQNDINVMVLNNNYPTINKKLDFKVSVDYMGNDDAQKNKVIPLFESGMSLFCPTEESPSNAGDTVCATASDFLVTNGPGKRTGHWIVPPGRQTMVYHLPHGLGLPYATTVHYIWMHVHPYAESIELRDITAGITVWKGTVKNAPDKAAVLETDRYSSAKGLPIYATHDYELISIYNNPTSKNADAMASLWMFFKEKASAPETEAPTGQEQSKVILSPIYKIDRLFKSMEGPQSSQQVKLLDGPPELVWITGFRTEMVEADGKTPTLPEFMCHVNLDFDPAKHREYLGSATNANSRILTLSQGMITVHFPKGFGMPVMSNESLSLATQVLNHNLEHTNMQVRHKVTFEFIRDRDLKAPLQPLFNTSVFGMKLLEGKDGHYGMAATDDPRHGPSCLPGAVAPNSNGGSVYTDGPEKKFTGHWVVKPGREVNHSNVTSYFRLPYDTTLHYAAVHLHPFAESLELQDLTTGKTVFKSKARGFKDKIGLEFVDTFSSRKGVPLYKDHEYDLISTYNNTTSSDKDSMAVMLLFLLDKKFKKPEIAIVKAPTEDSLSEAKTNPRLRLKTVDGEMTIVLYPKTAPKTVAHILELAKAGVFDTTPFYRVEPGFVIQTSLATDRTNALSPQQRQLLHPVELETTPSVKHERGMLSLAHQDNDPNSGDSSFSILLGNAPHLDGKYTIFGKVESGMDVLQKLEQTPRDSTNHPLQRLEIQRLEVLP